MAHEKTSYTEVRCHNGVSEMLFRFGPMGNLAAVLTKTENVPALGAQNFYPTVQHQGQYQYALSHLYPYFWDRFRAFADKPRPAYREYESASGFNRPLVDPLASPPIYLPENEPDQLAPKKRGMKL